MSFKERQVKKVNGLSAILFEIQGSAWRSWFRAAAWQEKKTYLCWDNKAPASLVFFTASTRHDKSIYLFIIMLLINIPEM